MDQTAVEEVLQAASTVVFVTLTVAKVAGLPAAKWLTPILETWSAAFSTGSWMSDFRNRTQMSGWVRSVEVTFEGHDPHAHIHAALVFDARPRESDMGDLIGHWMAAAARRGYRATLSAQSWKWTPAGPDRSRVAYYLCEQNAMRQSRLGKGRTPGDLLHSVAQSGDADDLELLLGFHEAVFRKQKISTSRGFWDLGLAPRGRSTR